MPYGKKFEKALLYAARAHADQKRKGTQIPYITHLLAVAAIVGENGGTENEVVAALLHDAIEDTPATKESLAARFGPEVAEIVAACSDADTFPKPPWKEQKEAYIEHIRHAPGPVRLVSSADKLHNARTILADLRAEGKGLWSRFKGGEDGTLWYYRALVRAFREAGTSPIVEELDRVVGEIERVNQQQHAEHARQR